MPPSERERPKPLSFFKKVFSSGTSGKPIDGVERSSSASLLLPPLDPPSYKPLDPSEPGSTKLVHHNREYIATEAKGSKSSLIIASSSGLREEPLHPSNAHKSHHKGAALDVVKNSLKILEATLSLSPVKGFEAIPKCILVVLDMYEVCHSSPICK